VRQWSESWLRRERALNGHGRLILQYGLLVLLLTLFGSLGTRACRLRLRLLLGGVTLGVGLILLGFALASQVVAPGDGNLAAADSMRRH
jgi:Na+/phosphate symporter